jgi:hypothetical protein
MPTINQLPLQTDITSGDQLPIYSQNNGDARRISVNSLFEYFEESLGTSEPTYIYTPVDGFNIPVPTPVSKKQWIVLNAGISFATGTITLPLNTITPDGTEVLVSTRSQVDALTININGASAIYPVQFSAPFVFFGARRFRFLQATNSWYSIV